MSSQIQKEVKCACGEIFEAEVWQSARHYVLDELEIDTGVYDCFAFFTRRCAMVQK